MSRRHHSYAPRVALPPRLLEPAEVSHQRELGPCVPERHAATDCPERWWQSALSAAGSVLFILAVIGLLMLALGA